MKKEGRTILVTGDLAIDNFSLIREPEQGIENETCNFKSYKTLCRYSMPGGAWLLSGFISQLSKNKTDVIEPEALITDITDKIINSHAILKEIRSETKTKAFFIKESMGYSCPEDASTITGDKHLRYPQDASGADVVVIDDAGNGFRNSKSLFPGKVNKDACIIYKMCSPLGKGKLWEEWIGEVDP
jgi:hypothetical protein